MDKKRTVLLDFKLFFVEIAHGDVWKETNIR